MIKTILIRILFKLLKFEDNTKHLIQFEDARKLLDSDDYNELKKGVELKYIKARAEVANIPNFVQWLYFEVVIKQRQYMLTIDKDKKVAQRAAVLSFLFILGKLRESDEMFTSRRDRKSKPRKARKKAANK